MQFRSKYRNEFRNIGDEIQKDIDRIQAMIDEYSQYDAFDPDYCYDVLRQLERGKSLTIKQKTAIDNIDNVDWSESDDYDDYDGDDYDSWRG